MLFVLNTAGVPSVASIVQVQPAAGVARVSDASEAGAEAAAAAEAEEIVAFEAGDSPGGAETLPLVPARGVVGGRRRTYLQVYAREAQVVTNAKGTAVVVGITGTVRMASARAGAERTKRSNDSRMSIL